MAVVQISKIQIRRGLKNSNTGVPQLSSAEFAWAVDTQELYIGNGSVAEGAPYVGNTKILTEHDNILDLASSYQFGNFDPSITESVSRSLQDKIDEIEVSVTDFGAVNDGSTDCTEAFETAFSQLFFNSNLSYRKVLKIPNGNYLFSRDLSIPPNALIRGETDTGVVLNLDTNNITFVNSDNESVSFFTSSNRPNNVKISNLTITRSSGQVVLTGLFDSVFEGVIFKGEYQLGEAISNFVTEPAAVFWENNIAGLKVNNIKFLDCKFVNNSLSIKCNQTTNFESYILYDNCDFFVNARSIFINGISQQGNNWKIRNSRFEEIAVNGFYSSNGTGTLIENCDFVNVGNGTNDASSPEQPMIYFGENSNNLVIDCRTNRLKNATLVTNDGVGAVEEVFNSSMTRLNDRVEEIIYLSDSFRPLAVLSSKNRFTYINYHLKLGPENGSYSRFGKITILIGDDLAGIDNVSPISYTDDYSFSPNFLTSLGGPLMTNFEFQVLLADNDDDSGIETMILYYRNPLGSGQTGTISFDVSYGV